jgi:hypothetical protein
VPDTFNGHLRRPSETSSLRALTRRNRVHPFLDDPAFCESADGTPGRRPGGRDVIDRRASTTDSVLAPIRVANLDRRVRRRAALLPPRATLTRS